VKRWPGLLLCAWLCGCGSSSELAGGGGIEGETVSLQGVATMPGGRPLGLATVSLRTPDWIEGNAEQSVQADSAGRFALQAAARRSFQIEARRDSLWMHRSLETSGNPLTVDLPTSVGTVWKAKLTPPAGRSPVRVDLYGGRSSSLVRDGGIALWRDPGNRSEWARVLLDDGTVREVALPPVTDSVIDLTQGGILLEDFEVAGNRSTLGSQIGSGWWYALNDSAQGGTSGILPTGSVHDVSMAFGTDSAWQGRGLSVAFVMDTTRPVHYAQLGLELAPKGLWMDLSRLDSFSFMARGSGTIQLRLQTSTGFDQVRDFGGDWFATVTLPATWSRIVLKPSDFKSLEGQPLPPSQALGKVRRALLHSEMPMTLRMDDLRFHGPTLKDLIPKP
jgi:hypothetical protein